MGLRPPLNFFAIQLTLHPLFFFNKNVKDLAPGCASMGK
jgi:hypothetical protein